MNRRLLSLGALAVLAAVACTEQRANLTDPVGATAYGYLMKSSGTNLPRGTVHFRFKTSPTATTADSIVLTISGIDSLSGGYYTAWAGDSLGTTFKRMTGLLTAVRTDTLYDAIGNVVTTPLPRVTVGTASAIQNGNPRTQYTWSFERVNAGLAASDSMVVFLITVEESATATTPHATNRPLFGRRSESSGAGSRTSALRFGNYSGDPAGDYRYVATPARGRGVIWGNVLEVTDSTLSRPPKGYYYAVWAIKTVRLDETTGDTLFVGDLTSPWPRRNLSLYDADVSRTDPVVVLDQPRSIVAGSVRISADTIPQLPKNVACTGYPAGVSFTCPYIGLTDVWLTLESKLAARGRMSPARILVGLIPGVVTLGLR